MTSARAVHRIGQTTGSRHLSLTRRFGLISLVGIAAVGLFLVLATSQALSAQATRAGTTSAETVARMIDARVPGDAYEAGSLEPATTARITALRAEMARVLSLRLWTADGTLLFDSEPSTADEHLPVEPDRVRLASVIEQRTASSRIVRDAAGPASPTGPAPHETSTSDEAASRGPVLEVWVPMLVDDRAVGAAHILVDGTETASAQAGAVRTIGLVAGVGLLGLWILLFRTVHNASERLQRTAVENARLAMLDALTGLPNRRMLLERLDRAVSSAHRRDHGVGILLLDLDRFKDVNDSLGHHRGDELLVQVAERLMDAFRGRDLVARLGGDEFAVLLPGLGSVQDAEALARRAREVFMAPFRLADMDVHVATSIGVAALPDHADDAGDLMRKADVAMYAAKQHRSGVAVYSAADDESSPSRLVLQAELHRALTGDGLAMQYQPKIDLVSGATVGLEALMRWAHPTRGDVGPGVFIPLAEQSGLIGDLTDFALRTVVTQLALSPAELRLPIAVNLSGRTLTSGDVPETILRLLAEAGVGPEWLEVEIAETALVQDPARILPALRRLASAGIRVAIDDFGVGATSFAHLRDLPVEVLKIDQVFVDDLRGPQQARARTVVKAMTDLAHSFGMQVVAEGVEDAETAAVLRELEVDQAQGFWYSHAVPAREALRLRGPVLT